MSALRHLNRNAGLTAAALVLLATTSSLAQVDRTQPPVGDIGIEQRLDQPLPLDAAFVDEAGRPVALGDYFGDKPVILSLVYYECPMLCTLVLNGMIEALDELEFEPGREFDIVSITIDPEETPELAQVKKEIYVKEYGREGARTGWHFLTGDQESIDAVTEAVGFRYFYDPDSGEYAHASGIMVITPEGRIARYFYGIEYAPRDLGFALMEASENRIGGVVNQLLLMCYQYDPKTGTYAAATYFIMRVGAVATVLALLTLFLLMRRRELRRQAA